MAANTIRIVACERFEESDAWKVQIKHGDLCHDTHLVNPFDANTEKSLRWYYERYPYFDPYATTRAHKVVQHLEEYATKLYEQVIDPFETIKTFCSTEQPVLSIEALNADQSIHKLHWEALQHQSLGLNIAVRRILRNTDGNRDEKNDYRRENHPSTVNLLFLTARRINVETQDVDSRMVLGPIVDLFSRLDSDSGVDFDVVRPGTLAELSRSLQRKTYDVLHLDVHGRIHQGKFLLQFVDPTNPAGYLDVAAEDIGALLAVHSVATVVLNACNSSTASLPTSTLAMELLKSGIQSVVGMAFAISATGATLFMHKFYECLLLKRHTIERAVHAGRKAMLSHKSRMGEFATTVELEDWLVPILSQRQHVETFITPTAEFTLKVAHSWPLSEKILNSPHSVITEHPKIFSRNVEGANLESILTLESRTVEVRAQIGAGKTVFLRELSHWWKRTKFVDWIIWLDYETQKSFTLPALRKALSTKFVDELEGCNLDLDKLNNLHDLLLTLSRCDRRTLIVIDHFDKLILQTSADQEEPNCNPFQGVSRLVNSSSKSMFLVALTALTQAVSSGGPTSETDIASPGPSTEFVPFILPILNANDAISLALSTSTKAAVAYQSLADERIYIQRLVKSLNCNPLAVQTIFRGFQHSALTSVKAFTVRLWTNEKIPSRTKLMNESITARFSHLLAPLYRQLSSEFERDILIFLTFFKECIPRKPLQLLRPILSIANPKLDVDDLQALEKQPSKTASDSIELTSIAHVLDLLEQHGLAKRTSDEGLLEPHPLLPWIILTTSKFVNDKRLTLAKKAYIMHYERRVHSREDLVGSETETRPGDWISSERSWPTGKEFLNFWIIMRMICDSQKMALFNDVPVVMMLQMLMPVYTLSYPDNDRGLVIDLILTIIAQCENKTRWFYIIARKNKLMLNLRRPSLIETPFFFHAFPNMDFFCDCYGLRSIISLGSWLMEILIPTSSPEDIKKLIATMSNFLKLYRRAFPGTTHRLVFQDVEAVALAMIGSGHYFCGNFNETEVAWLACKTLVADQQSPIEKALSATVDGGLQTVVNRRKGIGDDLPQILARNEETKLQFQKLWFDVRQRIGEHQYANANLQDVLHPASRLQLRANGPDSSNATLFAREEISELMRVYDQVGKNVSIPRAELLKQLDLQRGLQSSQGERTTRTMLAIDAIGREDWKETSEHMNWLERQLAVDFPDIPRYRVDRAWLLCESAAASIQLKEYRAAWSILNSAEQLIAANEETREERDTFVHIYDLFLDIDFSFLENPSENPVNMTAEMYIRYLVYANDPTTAMSSHMIRVRDLMPERVAAREQITKARQEMILEDLISKYILGPRYVERLDTTHATVKTLAKHIGINWFTLERFFFQKVCPVLVKCFNEVLEHCKPEENYFPDEKLLAARSELVRILFAPPDTIGKLEFFDSKYQNGLRTKWPTN